MWASSAVDCPQCELLTAIWFQVYAWACEVTPIWSVSVTHFSSEWKSFFFFSCLMIIISQRGRCRRCSFKHSVLSCPANRCLFTGILKFIISHVFLVEVFYQGCVLAPGECCLAVLVPLITCISFFFFLLVETIEPSHFVLYSIYSQTFLKQRVSCSLKVQSQWSLVKSFHKHYEKFFSGNIVVFVNKCIRHIW